MKEVEREVHVLGRVLSAGTSGSGGTKHRYHERHPTCLKLIRVNYICMDQLRECFGGSDFPPFFSLVIGASRAARRN